MVERRGRRAKYLKPRNQRCWLWTGCEKLEGEEEPRLLLAFWLEWEVVRLASSECGRRPGWWAGGAPFPVFLFEHLQLEMPRRLSEKSSKQPDMGGES